MSNRKRLWLLVRQFEVVQALEGMAEGDLQRWRELLSFLDGLLYYERDPGEYQPLHDIVYGSVQNDPYRQEVYAMGQTMAEILREQGRQEGRLEGAQDAKRQTLITLLRKKFGKIPAKLVRKIEARKSLDLLDQWFNQVYDAERLQDVPFRRE